MIERSALELINKDIDGVCTPEESSRLQEILRTNPEAKTLHNELQLLAVTMQKMPPAKPPRSLKPAILRALGAKTAPRRQISTAAGWWARVVDRRSRLSHNWRGAMENATNKTPRSPKPILVIVGSLAAIAVVVYFSFFYPPVPAGDTEGTIGAVKKYRTTQISEADVVLDALTSSNPDVVAKAITQTNAKLAENALALSKEAEAALAAAKTAEGKKFAENALSLAREAMAVKFEGATVEASKQYEKATELASQAEALKSSDKMKEASRLSEGVAVLAKSCEEMQQLGIRQEMIAVSAEARQMAQRMESSMAEGSRSDAAKILIEASQQFASRADALKSLGRTEAAAKIAEASHQLAAQADAVKAGVDAKEAMESSRVLAGKIETLARPEFAREKSAE
jgi:tetratricopeptide (TPR) repeat protein